MSELLHHALLRHARHTPDASALVDGARTLSYAQLAQQVEQMAALLLRHGVGCAARVAIYLEKCSEQVAAMLGAAAAGAVFVPINPLLRAEQVTHILDDCAVTILFTSAARLATLDQPLRACAALRTVFVLGEQVEAAPAPAGCAVLALAPALAAIEGEQPAPHRVIDQDMAAILYTSGSTGRPKGVVLSHRNLVAGAASVAAYLHLVPQDRILAVLPLSFDYGLNQLLGALHSGATCVLMNYLVPRDILDCVRAQRVTGLAAIAPLWQNLARLDWPADTSLRYLTNSGGAMPPATLARLRAALPAAEIFLMYGLTEAFRSTCLAPAELARRPTSIGKAVPNAEVMVLRPDGTPCAVDEAGELVHRGAFVALGYWNDPAATAQRFRPLPAREAGLPLAEIAVWSGDTVRVDAEGFFYYLGRRDELIKVSGYRISPSEIEAVLAAHPAVSEAVVFGVAHALTEQAIVAQVQTSDALDAIELQAHCRRHLPAYMVPAVVLLQQEALPRNPNGKYARAQLRLRYLDTAAGAQP